jgi:hypothetical protein
MRATRTATTKHAPGPASGNDRRSAILRRGRAVLQAESTAIVEVLQRLGDSFVVAVETILACQGRVCSPEALQCYAGTAPVGFQSGQIHKARFRRAC